MKILVQDLKKGEIKVQVTTLDDLWFLSHVIEEGDLVSGRTLRKIKIGDATEKSVQTIKKPVTLKIKVEKVEFHKFSNALRVSGKIIEAPEDVPHGSYHTFDVEEGTSIRIIKEEWPRYQIQKLHEASEEKGRKILIVALERDHVTYALLTPSGYKILSELEGDVGKKGYGEEKGKDFYADVEKYLSEYAQRYEVGHIILGSPAFWKEDLLKVIEKKNSTLAKKITLATCNTTGRNAIEEILKRDEVKTVLKNDRTLRETTLVEELFKEIAKDSLAAYGMKEVKLAAEAHAVKSLLVSDEFLKIQRESGTYTELDTIMKEVDRAQGSVHIISTEHDAGKKFHGLGGIGAILRYRLK